MLVLDPRLRIKMLEIKARRYVRTPEGAEKYGLPIGSLIVRRAQKISVRVASGKPIERAIGDVSNDRRSRFRKKKTFTREHENFSDYYEGIYGFDWTWGKEKEEDLADTNEARRKLAAKESKSIGISVIEPEEEGRRLDVAAHENVNSVMRAYTTMYPGIENLIPVFKYDPYSDSGTIAYNKPVKVFLNHNPFGLPRSADDIKILDNPSSDGYTREWDHTEIGLGPKFFKEYFYEWDVGSSAVQQSTGGWWSPDIPAFAKKHDMPLWQAGHVTTLNHEIGHTFGRIVLGEMSAEKAGPETTGKYRDELRKVLIEHEVISPYSASDPVTKFMTLNKVAVDTQISRYASANLHELMAEAWTSYMMDEEISELSYDIAQVMETAMVDWLANAYNEEA